jgi:hypothetical protein
VRRRTWSDVPLDVPIRVIARAAVVAPVALTDEPIVSIDEPIALLDEPNALLDEPIAMLDEPAADVEAPIAGFEQPIAQFEESVDVVSEPMPQFEQTTEPEAICALEAERPPVSTILWAGLTRFGAGLGRLFIATVEHLEPLGEHALRWMVRGAALASVASIVLVLGINRSSLFDRWERVATMVVAAANRPPIPPPPPAKPLADGMGRLTINSTKGAIVVVDGTPHGPSPVTLDLPAGAHRVLLRGEEGSVERTVRVQAAETGEITEAIFPGWVAVTTSIDLSLSEGGRALKRDERGWAILSPGPHDIHLDNNVLGVHEVRRVLVTPGDTTRLSFAPHTSTISLTTNELADVWIDGASYGQAPLVDQAISLGVHDVRVRSSAHERWLRVRATVQPLTVNVDLTTAN